MSTTEGASTEMERRTPLQELVSSVRSDQFIDQVKLALPETVSPQRFARIAVTAIQQTPDLAKCSRESVVQALLKCAADGLLPDGREAALVKFGDQAQYMPMIGGYRKIAADHGWTLRTRVVYSNDQFDHVEEPPALTHRPVRPGEERGDLLAAYAIATHQDGRRLQRVLYPEEIAQRRGMARSKNVWDTWTAQMWEKSAGRDLFGELPLGDLDRERVERIMQAERAFEQTAADPVRSLYGSTLHVVRELPETTGEPPDDDGTAHDAAADEPETIDGAAEDVAEPDEDAEMAALEAGQFELAFGKYKGQTLEQINEAASSGDSKEAKDAYSYLGFLMRKVTDKPDVVQAVWAFCRVYQPALFHEVLGEKETGRA